MKASWKSLVAGASLLAAACAVAQPYPNKLIRFVVGFPAGSSIDVVSRIVLDDVHVRTGATLVIENRPGALGALGMDIVSRAAPDGYTLMPSSSATSSTVRPAATCARLPSFRKTILGKASLRASRGPTG